jgi:UDP-N-acetylmuramyl pentapeptide synthase
MQCFFSADTKGLTEEILKILQPNDIVLVKGSNAVGMASVVTEIRAELGGYCKPLPGSLENAV